MAWLKFLKKDNSASDSRVLRDELFNAAGTGDEAAFDTMCLVNRDRIVCEFKTWQKVPAPVRADREALARYAHGLTAVADWFARRIGPLSRSNESLTRLRLPFSCRSFGRQGSR